MNELIGTWGVYPWFYEDSEDLIYPLDLYRFKERFLYSGGKVFFCKDAVDGYIILKYKAELFRVKPDLYKRVKMPAFDYGGKSKSKWFLECEILK